MILQKPLILITNDDGFFAKGIASLIETVKPLGQVVVVAPNSPQSGMSSAITSIHPIRSHLLQAETDYTLYACSGTPVDCIKLAMNVLLDRKPDLIVSGINHGANTAVSVLYSGTMAAAIEGCLFDVPSIGFSLLNHAEDANFEPTQAVIHALCKQVLADGLPKGTCLNVNFPDIDTYKGVKIVRQCKGKWVNEIKPATDAADKPIYWLSGDFANHEPQATDTDEAVLSKGYVSVVPVKIDMTDYSAMVALQNLEKLI